MISMLIGMIDRSTWDRNEGWLAKDSLKILRVSTRETDRPSIPLPSKELRLQYSKDITRIERLRSIESVFVEEVLTN